MIINTNATVELLHVIKEAGTILVLEEAVKYAGAKVVLESLVTSLQGSLYSPIEHARLIIGLRRVLEEYKRPKNDISNASGLGYDDACYLVQHSIQPSSRLLSFMRDHVSTRGDSDDVERYRAGFNRKLTEAGYSV